MEKEKFEKELLKYFDFEIVNSKLKIVFKDDFFISNSQQIEKEFKFEKKLKSIVAITCDFSELKSYDSFIVIYLESLFSYCSNNDIAFEIVNMDERLNSFSSLLKPQKIQLDDKEKTSFINYIENIGETVKEIWNESFEFLEFVGATLKSLLKTLIRPKTVRWKDFPELFNNIGVNALPINILIILLLGFITGWQGALQLKLFGADQFLAPLVGFSIIQVSPIMVAIIVSGRSGSAFTAEIGTMKVSEELDALVTMGFDKYSFLVVPRILALMISMPLLVMICDVVEVIGGLIAGLTTLNITIVSYFNELNSSMAMIDVSYGLVKSLVFGLAIAIIGCFRGLKVTNSAESVGKNTTSSVVTSIFTVIIIDALFVVLYDAVFN